MFSTLWLQFKETNQKPNLVKFNYRVGGGSIKIYDNFKGVHIQNISPKLSCGHDPLALELHGTLRANSLHTRVLCFQSISVGFISINFLRRCWGGNGAFSNTTICLLCLCVQVQISRN